MLDRARLGSLGDLQHVVGHEVAPAMGMGEAAPGVITVPRAGLQRQEVVAEIEVDGNAFPFGPVEVGIDEKLVGDIDFGIGKSRRIGRHLAPLVF